jgi:methionine-rich copper-binding protein CopC
MFSILHGGRRLGAVALALGLLVATASNAFAHARYDRSEPPAGSMTDGQPFVLTAYFTQELTSKSTIRVLDANGVQVDLADGHVDLNDPDRKIMYVSLPELPVGVYTVEYVAESAEDGHAEPGTFAFGVGMTPPSATDPGYQPSGSSSPLPVENADAMVLDAY